MIRIIIQINVCKYYTGIKDITCRGGQYVYSIQSFYYLLCYDFTITYLVNRLYKASKTRASLHLGKALYFTGWCFYPWLLEIYRAS